MPVGVQAAAVSNGHHTHARYVRQRDTAARFTGATCGLFKHSAELRRRRELLFIQLVDAFEREHASGTDILRDVLYRRRTRPVVPRRPFTRTAWHRR